MNRWIKYEYIWREITGGVVFVERISEYEELLRFCKSAEYMNYYKNNFSEYDDYHIQKVITDIKEGKSNSSDIMGLPIEIHSMEKLKSLDKEFYLVLKPNKLFSIYIGKNIKEILDIDNLRDDKESIVIKDNLQMHVKYLSKEYNFTVRTMNPFGIFDVNGTAIFTAYKPLDEYSDIDSIEFNDILYIIHNMRFFLGAGTLTIM